MAFSLSIIAATYSIGTVWVPAQTRLFRCHVCEQTLVFKDLINYIAAQVIGCSFSLTDVWVETREEVGLVKWYFANYFGHREQ